MNSCLTIVTIYTFVTKLRCYVYFHLKVAMKCIFLYQSSHHYPSRQRLAPSNDEDCDEDNREVRGGDKGRRMQATSYHYHYLASS